MEKIDIHNSQKNYSKALEKLDKEKKISKKNKELIKDFLEASAIGRTARRNSRKKEVGLRARIKNLYLMKVAAKGVKKDFDTLSMKDIEKFIKDLNENKIKKEFHNEKEPYYSGETKTNIKKAFIRLLRWIHNGNKKFHDLTDWIETITPKKEIPALSEKDILLMIKSCNTIKQKFLIAFLFNSGARIEEFLNIRIGDLTLIKEDPKYYTVSLKEEFSKTKGRTIPLNWKGMTDLIEEWLELHPNKDDLNAPLYPSTYDGARVIVGRIGKKALGKHVYPHLIRHSSATYDANTLNRYQLCYKYGWAFSSPQPDRYIDRAKITAKEIAKEYQKELREELEKRLESVEEQNKILRDSDSVFAEKIILLTNILKKHGIPERALKELKEINF